jgi:hypothetical protein
MIVVYPNNKPSGQVVRPSQSLFSPLVPSYSQIRLVSVRAKDTWILVTSINGFRLQKCSAIYQGDEFIFLMIYLRGRSFKGRGVYFYVYYFVAHRIHSS